MDGSTSLDTYKLSDCYQARNGRIFLTGIQALVRLPMMQAQMDARDGLKTAGFISGYRGSPLGGYDQELWRNEKILQEHDVHFEPGVNEDLGATAVWGTQQLDHYGNTKYDGVYGIWYGKGPGVDRTGDVFRNANILGTSKHGGVLALSGDDHAAQSSMFPHQTDHVFESCMIPILAPASVTEILEFGLMGWALSRYSGCWVALKVLTEIVESGEVVNLPKELPTYVRPDHPVPPHGFNYDPTLKWPAERMQLEYRLLEERIPAIYAWAYANNVDRTIWKSEQPKIGIVTVGKAHGDLMEALRILGLSEKQAKAAGVSVFKVGMTWPLDPRKIGEFSRGLDEIIIVEEKRPLVEKQLKEQLFNWPVGERPAIYGLRDQHEKELFPMVGEFSPELVAEKLVTVLSDTKLASVVVKAFDEHKARTKALASPPEIITRKPFFCAGCPHNRSTKVPEGSKAGGGIGCHVMVLGQGRNTDTFSQMGGEGIAWVGLSRFTEIPHTFQNMGDGTYQHSGILAIRQAVAANVNITYKILYNDAVAMTGGQPAEGTLTVGSIATQCRAEGVDTLVVVSDDIIRTRETGALAVAETIHPRSELEAIQRRLRETKGVTVIIYDQTCAAEKRRRRKKGLMPDPKKRLFINDRVCEGCGDCSVQSNCIAVEPLETPFGRKRQINQNSCNKDYSCNDGFCPSFVTLNGVEPAKPDQTSLVSREMITFASLSYPILPELKGGAEFGLLVAGIGGTGVVTVGGVLSMAAHLDGKGATVLDFTGLAQKNGAVISQVKIAENQADICVPRILQHSTDLVIGCDMVVTASNANFYGTGKTKAVVNDAEIPTAHFTQNTDMDFPAAAEREAIERATGSDAVSFLNAGAIAEQLFGNSIATNMFLVGYAWQKGLLPLSLEAIMQAIKLNGVAVDANKRYFSWGRVYADKPGELLAFMDVGPKDIRDNTLDAIIGRNVAELTAYQNAAYARRYSNAVEKVRAAEKTLDSGEGLTRQVVSSYYKVLAYKDEYEVARLYTDGVFGGKIANKFDGLTAMTFHMAPPLISKRDPVTGERQKRAFSGRVVMPMFKLMRLGKKLRGTWADPFGYQEDRKVERQLILDYETALASVLPKLTASNYDDMTAFFALPEKVRGYGHVKMKSLTEFYNKWVEQYKKF